MKGRAPLSLAVLISGRGSNMVAIAQACAMGQINAFIKVVISDQSGAAGIEVARNLGLVTKIVARAAFTDAAAFEEALARALHELAPELIVFAGFMRILSPSFVTRYAGRMLNIHPSLLPQYRGLHTHRRVLAAGDAEHGASVHFVTPELDAGPIVLQSVVAVRAGDTEKTLAARVLASEHIIYPRVIGWIADGRVALREGRAWLDGAPLNAPLVENMRGTAGH
jgi:phosphoribosylglycinamide formyltransferase 1